MTKLTGWRLSFSNNTKDIVNKGLAYMMALSMATPRGKELASVIAELADIFKEKGIVDKEITDGYNKVADMAMDMIQQNAGCARLIEALGGMEVTKQALFCKLDSPEEWFRKGVDLVCSKLEGISEVAPPSYPIKDVVYLFRNFGARGDMPDGYWRMLQVIDVAATQLVVSTRVFEGMTEWIKEGKGDEAAALACVERHEKELSIPLEVVMHRKMFHEGSWEEALNS